MVAPVRMNATYAEYLELERSSDQKHIFVDGAILAMSGGSPRHAQLAARIISELGRKLAGKPCQAFTSDLRVLVRRTELHRHLATYPDVTVICGSVEHDPSDDDAATNPLVLVEVVSKTSQKYDREEKFALYRRIPSLRAYLVVEQDERAIEVATRNEDGSWTLREFTQGAAPIPPLECALSLDEIYADPLSR